jgi:hypothetical protein
MVIFIGRTYIPSRKSSGTTPTGELEAKGFYRMDTYSLVLLVLSVVILLVAWLPIQFNPDLTFLGHPWGFFIPIILGVVYTLIFVVSTYYIDSIQEGG